MDPKSPFRIVILASTNGTDLQAIIDEIKAGKMPGIELTAVISNKKKCYAIERAQAQGYRTIHISPRDPQTREVQTKQQFDTRLIETIDPLKPNLVVLVGYMRILTPEFIGHFLASKTPIINVHPSLIPKFCGQNFYGKSVHEAVLAAGEKETGMTIHRVDIGIDSGEILLQKSIPIAPDDTPETLKFKVQELEKKYYPEVIRRLAVSSRLDKKFKSLN